MRSLIATITAVAFLATSAHAANTPVTEVRAYGCLEDSGLPDWARAVFDASEATPDARDPRISTALLLAPKFARERAFHEPSGFDAALALVWDHSPRVADDVSSTTVVPAGEAGPGALAAHSLWGMGKQVVVLHVEGADGTVRNVFTNTIALDAATAEIEDWKNDPLAYYRNTLPGFSVTRLASPSTAAVYRKIAATIPAQWQAFLAAEETIQAETIGAAATTAGLLAVGKAKGTGAPSLSRWINGRPPISLFKNGVVPGLKPPPVAIIERLHPLDLTPTHGLTMSKTKFRAIKADVRENGVIDPIPYVEINGVRYLVGGHHRVEAAIQTGKRSVPVVRVELPYESYKTVADLEYSP